MLGKVAIVTDGNPLNGIGFAVKSSTMATYYKKLQVSKLSANFAEAVSLVDAPLTAPEAGHVLIRIHYAGVAPTDVMVSAGTSSSAKTPPFDIGMEALGVVQEVAPDVRSIQKGQAVVFFGPGYAEYVYVADDKVFPIPEVKPEYLALLGCGLTASMGLDEAGRIKAGDKVLITAAAGGVGQVAVQWAKMRGCHVIGTTSSDEKGNFLKSIGIDHVINYKKDDLSQTLMQHYPQGVDVMWDTIGGETTIILFNHLATMGRLVVVGGISGYATEGMPNVIIDNLPSRVLLSSLSINGFLVYNHAHLFHEYWTKLMTAMNEGKIRLKVDDGETTAGGSFIELSDAGRAVQHLLSGKNEGKVVLRIQ
jgi:hypothetical protein